MSIFSSARILRAPVVKSAFGRMTTKIAAAVAISATAFGLSTTAHATIQAVLTAVSVGANTTTYTIQLALTPNNGLHSSTTDPSGLIVLDFPGFISAQLSSSGSDITSTGSWALSNSLTGAGSFPGVTNTSGNLFLTGSGITVGTPDNADLQNIVLRYTGSELPVVSTAKNMNLLHLTVISTAGPSFAPLNALSRNSTSISSSQLNTYSISSSLSGGDIPEPASLGVLGLGVMGLLLKRRR